MLKQKPIEKEFETVKEPKNVSEIEKRIQDRFLKIVVKDKK